MRNILISVVAAAGLMGCVGGIDAPSVPSEPPADGVGGGGTGTAALEARKLFEDNVHPVLLEKCNGCHNAEVPSGATGFVATAKADSYVTAVGYQAVVGNWTATGAPILTKLSPEHKGKTYTDAEKSKITAWLAKELESRAGGGTPTTGGETPAAITERLTKEWSGCMTAANFATANMKAWGNMRANNSACKTCHGNGEYGFIALDSDPQFFEAISTDRYYMAQYFSPDPKANKMVINTRSFNGVRQGVAPHLEHPRFTLDGSTGLAALQKFYDLTMAAKTAGTCGTPTLKN